MEVETELRRLRERLTRPAAVDIPDSPVEFVESLGYHPYPYQVELLNAVAEDGPQKVISMWARQCGKSTTCNWLALWFAMAHPGTSTILVSPTLRQSSLLMDKILSTWTQAGKPIRGRTTALTLKLDNQSRILALPGGNPLGLRGHSCQLLLEDESARCSPALHAACLPFLAAQKAPKLVMVSTPWIAAGDYYDIWTKGKGWTRLKVTVDMCPSISKEYLSEQRQRLGPFYEVEYGCQWLQNESNLFSRAVLDRCITDGEDLGWLLDPLIDSEDSYDYFREEREAGGTEGDEIVINDLPFDFEAE
jgi:hypothetical protein